MARTSKSVRFFDFTGGLNTKSPTTSVADNEAVDLQNIVLLPSGGFVKRRGNSAFCTAMESGATVHGLGYFRLASGAHDYLMAVSKTELYKTDDLDGTMDKITGALTITTGQDNIWTMFGMNNWIIGVGGAPDAPWVWKGSGNAAALGGTPPSGNFGFMANNYAFIGNTSANPSRIQWSILGNPEDWSGTGSGTQDVQTNDGDTLVGAATIGNDRVLLFKQNSIHDMIVTAPPFPVSKRFQGVGAVSKRGIVTVGDMTYFITPEPRMKATDGYKVYDFPDLIDPTWDGLSKSRLPYIQGIYYPRLRQLWWICSNGSSATNNYCIIWDLDRKCWLRHTSGYGMNCVVLAQDRYPYGGAYDGIIYQLDKASTFSDASESNPVINAYWRSGWMDMDILINTKVIPYVNLSFVAQTAGTFDFKYGYNFTQDTQAANVNMVGISGYWDLGLWDVMRWAIGTELTKWVNMKGNGKHFQFAIINANANEQLQFNGLELPIKVGSPATIK